jgi:2,5-furandicarboxylate decarboxylase 1
VELIRAETVAVDVPARAEIIIEGRVLPGVREPEGPFGENTGAYFSNISPVVEVTAVTHRRDFIFPALCPGPPTSTPCSRWRRHRTAGPVAHPDGGVRSRPDPGTCGFAAVIAVIELPEATDVRRLIHLALAIDKRLKVVTVVDDDVDIRDPREVAWALATRFQPDARHGDPVRHGRLCDRSILVPAAPARAWAWTPRAAAAPNSIRSRLPAAAVAKARAVLAELGIVAV